MLIHEDSRFTLEQADFCALPGYLILRGRRPLTSPTELDLHGAEALGRLLAAATAALEETADAERVYWLVFAEADRRFYVHLLPRTAWLARAWRGATNAPEGRPVDGPALFQWCRSVYHKVKDLPAEASALDELLPRVRGALRRRLARQGLPRCPTPHPTPHPTPVHPRAHPTRPLPN